MIFLRIFLVIVVALLGFSTYRYFTYEAPVQEVSVEPVPIERPAPFGFTLGSTQAEVLAHEFFDGVTPTFNDGDLGPTIQVAGDRVGQSFETLMLGFGSDGLLGQVTVKGIADWLAATAVLRNKYGKSKDFALHESGSCFSRYEATVADVLISAYCPHDFSSRLITYEAESFQAERAALERRQQNAKDQALKNAL